jgi:membrane-associated phospholipid phosphatase
MTTQAYADDFNKTKNLGAATGSTRTADQTQIALFWADGAGTVTPPGHWNDIAVTVAQTQDLDLVQDARLFALLNIALADAGIAAWDMKRHYDFWRPISAIQLADTDGNNNTIADTGWTPLLTTPPFPTYVSGHSTFSGAAAQLLKDFFGMDIAFTTDSDALPLIFRSFDTFWDAAAEAGESRIYGGIHWEFDTLYGLLAGQGLGNFVFANELQAVPVPSGVILLGTGLLGLLGWGWGRKGG